jgi:uncharacterized protein with HEPN domain
MIDKAQRGIRQRLGDILAEIETIDEINHRIGLDAALADRIYLRSIERCILIISEASRHLPATVLNQTPTIPWKKIRGIGNVIRHDYEIIDPDVPHHIVAFELGPLGEACRAILSRLD